MGNDHRRLCMLHRCLRGHAAGPEYGDLSLIEIHCIAVIRLHDVPDPNLRPISHMDRSTMDIGHLFCDRIRLLGILRRHGPHGADHGAFKGAGLHSLYIRLIHGHVPALGNVAYLDPSLHQRLLKGKGAADEKARIIPPIVMSLEESLEYIKEDEYLEVTPHHLRIRKIILDEIERKRANR